MFLYQVGHPTLPGHSLSVGREDIQVNEERDQVNSRVSLTKLKESCVH